MLLALVLACYTDEAPLAGPDRDGDGYEVSRDCDDGDPTVYPGAPERCDGVSNDCDDPDADEAGLVSLEDGGWDDLTALWAAGAPGDPAVLALPDSGVVHVCPGTWYVHLVASGGAVELRGEGSADEVVLDASGVGSVIVGSETNLTVTGVTLTGGIGSGDMSTYGGALYQVGGALTLDRVVVRDNLASKSGAGIYAWVSSVTLVDSEFSGNRASESGGGAYLTETNTMGEIQPISVSVSGCLFKGNTADQDGGGLAFEADDVGAASSLSVEGGEFAGNQSDYGGGLSARGIGVEVFIGSEASFADNTANYDGGGFYIAAGSAEVQASVTDNSARRGGGAFVDITEASLRDATFERNDAVVGGAVVAQCRDEPGAVRIQDTVLEGNTAQSQGGALRAFGCELVVVDSSLASNRSERGGAVEASEATVTFSGVTLEGNEASFGGAARLGGSLLQCGDGGVFHRNAASEHGGAVCLADSSFLSDGCGFGETGTGDDNTAGGQSEDVFSAGLGSAAVYGEDAWFSCDATGCE